MSLSFPVLSARSAINLFLCLLISSTMENVTFALLKLGLRITYKVYTFFELVGLIVRDCNHCLTLISVLVRLSSNRESIVSFTGVARNTI